jgi:signal transduction histidine kinase
LLALAEQIGASVENHRLRKRIEAAVALEERGRLARDLHDSVTQSLYSLSLFARSGRDAADEGDVGRLVASLEALEVTSVQALREMRLLLYELRPEALEQEGLFRTLERRFDAVERRAGMHAALIAEPQGPDSSASLGVFGTPRRRLAQGFAGEAGLDLPPTLERELYYLATEALNNVLKHARANKVTVLIGLSGSQVRLEIADDGCGFDLREVSGGYGLGDMQERVERLGGRLEIFSAPNAGTRITAWVDLTPA